MATADSTFSSRASLIYALMEGRPAAPTSQSDGEWLALVGRSTHQYSPCKSLIHLICEVAVTVVTVIFAKETTLKL